MEPEQWSAHDEKAGTVNELIEKILANGFKGVSAPNNICGWDEEMKAARDKTNGSKKHEHSSNKRHDGEVTWPRTFVGIHRVKIRIFPKDIITRRHRLPSVGTFLQ